jgi:hypothetical protein
MWPSPQPSRSALTPTARLWRIPAAGGATQLGTIAENILFSDLYWNDSGTHLAYTRLIDETGSPTPRLMIASGSGQLPPDGSPTPAMSSWGCTAGVPTTRTSSFPGAVILPLASQWPIP